MIQKQIFPIICYSVSFGISLAGSGLNLAFGEIPEYELRMILFAVSTFGSAGGIVYFYRKIQAQQVTVPQ